MAVADFRGRIFRNRTPSRCHRRARHFWHGARALVCGIDRRPSSARCCRLASVGSAAFPRGGLGSFTRALAESAKQAGAEIRTDAEVQQIRIKDRRCHRVVLSNGEEIAVEAVVSGADPKRTFFNLVDASQLDPTFRESHEKFPRQWHRRQVNLALGGLPSFTALDSNETPLKALSGRIHIGPEIDYLERAFDASKYGDFSKTPGST